MNMRTRILEDLRESGASISVDSFDTMFPERGDPLTLQLGHESADGATIWLEPDEESDGTTALINRLHGVLSALDLGDLLILDEFDLGLHPNLLPLILGLFTDRRLNPRSAQLLFTAHQTALMTQLRRDEVVVVEKLRHGESKLASIAEYRALKREDMERYYRAGRYGGVPRLGAIDAGMSAGAPAASPPAEAGAR
jgi:AAA15 family ATPase/GTPase